MQLLLRRFPEVLIAAVNGAAYGAGLDLACAADFRLAADTARFCEVYVRLGLAPGGGGAWLLPRIVGLTNALDLILSGEPIDAHTALSIGLVSRVVPADELPAATREFARRFALSAPRGVQVAKRTVLRGLEMSFEAALDFIRPQIGVLRQTEDHKEGLRALQERRHRASRDAEPRTRDPSRPAGGFSTSCACRRRFGPEVRSTIHPGRSRGQRRSLQMQMPNVWSQEEQIPGSRHLGDVSHGPVEHSIEEEGG
jgi:hypothetical protein